MSKFLIARKSPVFHNRTRSEAQRNDTHSAPKIDDEWERMYLDDGDKEFCQNTNNSSIIDDELEKNYLNDTKEMYIPLPQIDDNWEAMYMDDNEQPNNTTSPRIIDDESGKNYLNHTEVDDDWEAMYMNDNNNFTNDEDFLKQFDDIDLEQDDLLDYSSSRCSSSLSVLGLQNVEEIYDNSMNEVYLEDD